MKPLCCEFLNMAELPGYSGLRSELSTQCLATAIELGGLVLEKLTNRVFEHGQRGKMRWRGDNQTRETLRYVFAEEGEFLAGKVTEECAGGDIGTAGNFVNGRRVISLLLEQLNGSALDGMAGFGLVLFAQPDRLRQ